MSLHDVLTATLEIATRIEESSVGVAIAESRYAFFFIEGVHLIGLSIAVGLIAITDLRLMGLILKSVPARTVVQALRPWVIGGFAVIMVSGALLFWSAAARVTDSPAFALKMGFIVLAGLNAAWFEFIVSRREPPAGNPVGLPKGARFAGFASLSLWTLVIVTGRLIAYLPHWS